MEIFHALKLILFPILLQLGKGPLGILKVSEKNHTIKLNFPVRNEHIPTPLILQC